MPRIAVDVFVHNHPTDGELIIANAALSAALSDATSVVSTLRSENESLSTALSAADPSTAVSNAIEAEDNQVASEISQAIA